MTTTTAPAPGVDAKDTHALRTRAAEAMQEGVEGAKRAIEKIRHGIEEAAVKRDELVHRVKQEPVKAAKYSFGAGLLVGSLAGIVAGLLVARRRRADM